jgi:trehalose-phosphatase
MTSARPTTPHLFAEWERVARRIHRKKRLVIFLDFDGTLVRIAPKPEAVRLEQGTRDVLQKLAGHRNVVLVVISGRQRADLQHYIGIRGIRYMGLYGWECSGKMRIPFPVREVLAHTLVSLRAALASYPGVWIEPKHNSFSVHLLGTSSETQRQVRLLVKKHLKPLEKTLQEMENLRDVEVAPVAIGDKGVAVRKFISEPALRGALPVYFGDDFSDELAFVATRKGIPILVGKRRMTRAKYSLRGPAEVAAALSRMEEVIR